MAKRSKPWELQELESAMDAASIAKKDQAQVKIIARVPILWCAWEAD